MKEKRFLSISQSETCQLVQPGTLNVNGMLFGGQLVAWIDTVAAIAAYKIARGRIVTMAIDNLVFLDQVPPGSLLTLKAQVNRIFHSSMEVGVKVYQQRAEDESLKTVCKTYLTFVAVHTDGTSREVEQAYPFSKDEKRRWKQAAIRREARIKLKEELEKHAHEE